LPGLFAAEASQSSVIRREGRGRYSHRRACCWMARTSIPVVVCKASSATVRPSASDRGATKASATTSSASPSACATTGWGGSSLSTSRGHRPRRVGDALGGGGDVEQTPQRVGVVGLGGGRERPRLRGSDHSWSVRASIAVTSSASARSRSRDGGVGQPDGNLARVLQVHTQVDRAVEFGQPRVFGGRRELMGRAAGEAADHVDPVRRSLEEQHVTDLQSGVAARPVEEQHETRIGP